MVKNYELLRNRLVSSIRWEKKLKIVKKNILYIVQSGKLGGAEISMLLLLKYLNKNRYNPIVLAPVKSDIYLRVKELEIETIDFTLPRIKSYNPIRLILNIFLLIYCGFKIKRIINNNQISLVHTVSNKRSAIYGILAARLAKIPAIWTIRNLEWLGIIDKFMIANSTRLITVSDAVMRMFNRKKENKFIKIYNAIDLSNFPPTWNSKRPLLEKWDFKRTDFLVAMVGRLTPEKGHHYFIEAVSIVLQKKPDIKFLIIGERKFFGNNDYYLSLTKHCQQLDLINKIQFIDFEKNVAAIMATIDLLVLFSDNEPFGRVLIEAMAMEKPVITSNAGGAREIVEHNITGLLVEPKNVSELANAIMYLYKSQEKAQIMGQEGRKRVEKYFTVDRYVESHQKLYHEVLN